MWQENWVDCGVHVIVLAERTAHIPRAARQAAAWGNHKWHFSSVRRGMIFSDPDLHACHCSHPQLPYRSKFQEDIEIGAYFHYNTPSMRLSLAHELAFGSLRRPMTYCDGDACKHWTLADRDELAKIRRAGSGAV